MSTETQTTGKYKALIEYAPASADDSLPWRARLYPAAHQPGSSAGGVWVASAFGTTREECIENAKAEAARLERDVPDPEWVEL